MEQILITGGAGFIGSNLVDALVKLKQPVIVLDNFDDFYSPTRKRKNLKEAKASGLITLIEGDVRDSQRLAEMFKRFKIKKVVHLAALAGVRPSFKQPKLYEEVNVGGTVKLLEEAKKHKIQQFILASSSSVYGKRRRGPFRERDRTNKPQSPYAASKKEAELRCRAAAEANGLHITVVRIFTAYGPRNRPDMACYKFTEALAKNKPIEVYGDGLTGRDYTFVGDIVDGFLKILEQPRRLETVNLGNANVITVNQLIKTLEKVTGKKGKIVNRETVPGDVPLTFANVSRAKKIYAWQPKVKLDQGLKYLWEWYLKEQ